MRWWVNPNIRGMVRLNGLLAPDAPPSPPAHPPPQPCRHPAAHPGGYERKPAGRVIAVSVEPHLFGGLLRTMSWRLVGEDDVATASAAVLVVAWVSEASPQRGQVMVMVGVSPRGCGRAVALGDHPLAGVRG